MVEQIATRLQKENRQLRELITEMQAILGDAVNNNRIEQADIDAVFAKAETLGITP